MTNEQTEPTVQHAGIPLLSQPQSV